MTAEIKIIYEDADVLVVDKPAGIIVIPDLIDLLIEKYPELKAAGSPPRYGIVHRLDKDTSGILLVAKTTESLIFLQKEFINRKVDKKYTALACGNIKEDSGTIKTFIGRSKGDHRKQTVSKDGREAITEYKVIERFKDYTLLEVKILTGRRHQIRCHLSFIHHPIAGDKLYGFKDSPLPKELIRQFLHAYYLKIQLPSGETKEFNSKLPEELKIILNTLEKNYE